jgi:hypothetical protein
MLKRNNMKQKKMTEKKGNKTLHTTKLQARRKAILSIAASV